MTSFNSRLKSLFGEEDKKQDNDRVYKNKANNLLSYSDKSGQSDAALKSSRQNMSKLLGETDTDKSDMSARQRINPYLNRDGTLKNNYIDYQKLLDSEKTSDSAKDWIKQATGLEETTAVSTSGSAAKQNNTRTALSPGGKRGFVSAKYETGGWNPGLVSSGSGDYGGVSYGLPQFSTTTGSAASFVKWLKEKYPEMGNEFGSASPGTSEFGNAWKSAHSKYGDKFASAQTSYAFDSFVKPLANLAKQKTGIDYTSTDALYELIYSTAIQFGGGSLGLKALGNVHSGMSEKDIINASYDTKINNVGSFFRSSSDDVQNGVRNRFKNERNDVLALARER